MGVPLSDKKILSALRSRLKPHGSSDLVRLALSQPAFFNHDFVSVCIDELQKKVSYVRAGMAEFTGADTLALHVLADNANLSHEDFSNTKCVIEVMREVMKPQGTAAVVHLTFEGFYKYAFIQQLCDEIEKKSMTVISGLDKSTALETLAFNVMTNSADIDMKQAV